VILEPSGLPESPSGELADGMTLHKSSRDRGWGYFDTQFEQFLMETWCSPDRIRQTHLSD